MPQENLSLIETLKQIYEKLNQYADVQFLNMYINYYEKKLKIKQLTSRDVADMEFIIARYS